LPEPTQTAKKQQVVTKPSKPFFSFLFALLSQFAKIRLNFHYVFIMVQPERARRRIPRGTPEDCSWSDQVFVRRALS
jgi:hypothetical protein